MITRLNYLFDLAPDVQNIIAIIERLLSCRRHYRIGSNWY
jgi:hypothetical protein